MGRPEHPHGRGEKTSEELAELAADGTSPRAWGEAADQMPGIEWLRNIPTGVGRRRRPGRRPGRRPEHPHGRGEKADGGTTGEGKYGTSPRAWGEETAVLLPASSRRNIPTGVGRRCLGSQDDGIGQEHPHGRGEKELKAQVLIV